MQLTVQGCSQGEVKTNTATPLLGADVWRSFVVRWHLDRNVACAEPAWWELMQGYRGSIDICGKDGAAYVATCSSEPPDEDLRHVVLETLPPFSLRGDEGKG